MADRPLTVKQQLFVEAYLGRANGNATEAARLAGYSGNDKTLSVVGAENLAKPCIAEAVGERLEAAKEAMGADEVLAETADIARAPWRDFVEVQWDDEGEVLRAKLPLRDKLKALELMGKHHKLWLERVAHEGDQTIRVIYEDRTMTRPPG